MLTPTVYVVDDDEGSRNSIECLFSLHGIHTSTFESPQKFLDTKDIEPVSCLVTDLNMPGMNGIELFERARQKGMNIPAIIITAFGEVASCAGAIRAGIVDYLEKPVQPETLISRVRECLSVSEKKFENEKAQREAERKLKSLTSKESEVMELLVQGQSMKTIASDFGTSFQAVSRHRQRILEKLGVEGDVSLARWVLDHRRAIAANQAVPVGTAG
jgi:two-component system, LuxR family, response regulator FixJ